MNHRHFEVIGHPLALRFPVPGKSQSLQRPFATPQNGWFSTRPYWLVLPAP
jgi:hypothetical protein